MESLPYFCDLTHAVGFMLLANISRWKKRGLMNSLGHSIFLIFRLLHSGEITRSKPAASYLMHWLAPRNLIISSVAFLIIKYIMPIHLPVLKTGALYLQKTFMLCMARVSCSYQPVNPHAGNLNINFSSLPQGALLDSSNMSRLLPRPFLAGSSLAEIAKSTVHEKNEQNLLHNRNPFLKLASSHFTK